MMHKISRGPIFLLLIIFVQIALAVWHRPLAFHIGPLVYCVDRATCAHEVAHVLDNASSTEEFQHSIHVYRIYVWEYKEIRDEYALHYMQFPGIGSELWANYNIFTSSFWQGGWGGYHELYASIPQWYEGNEELCPKGLRHYWDWDKLNKVVDELMAKDIKIMIVK